MFAGSSHVTRTLLVEPGIPATLGAAGAGRRLANVVDRDRHRLRGDAVVLPLPVVHLDRHRVALPRLVVESRPRPYLAGRGDDRERVLARTFEAVGQAVAVRVRGRDRIAEVLPGPRVLVHSQFDDRIQLCQIPACCCSGQSCHGLTTTSSRGSRSLRSSPLRAPRTACGAPGALPECRSL